MNVVPQKGACSPGEIAGFINACDSASASGTACASWFPIADGNTTCASAYQEAIECIVAAGCAACSLDTVQQNCEQTIFAAGGACHGYFQTFYSACVGAGDLTDAGVLAGPCSNDATILSLICGNGSGDGG